MMISVETEDVVTTAVGVVSWKTRTMLIPRRSDHGSHADVREDSRQNFVAGYQASDADGGIEQKNAKEQRSEEANDGKQCHTDVVRDADQGKSMHRQHR